MPTELHHNCAIHTEGDHVTYWERSEPVALRQPGFEVEVYVEGYRLNKDVWLHSKEQFDTLEQALEYYHKIANARFDEYDELLDFKQYDSMGWHSISYEYMRVLEFAANGQVFEWERKRP